MLEKQLAKEEKAKAKEEKEKAKELKKKNKNVIIDAETVGCIEILKSGLNKGKPCGCNIIIDNLCNRHFKIKHNITNNV